MNNSAEVFSLTIELSDHKAVEVMSEYYNLLVEGMRAGTVPASSIDTVLKLRAFLDKAQQKEASSKELFVFHEDPIPVTLPASNNPPGHGKVPTKIKRRGRIVQVP